MHPLIAVVLVLAVAAAMLAAVGLYFANQPSVPPPDAACSGALTDAQVQAMDAQGVGVALDFPSGVPKVSVTGAQALATSEARLGSGVAPAPCVMEALVALSTESADADNYFGTPYNNFTCWMVVLQGVGIAPAPTATIPAGGHGQAIPAGAPAVSASGADAYDRVFFLDAYANVVIGDISIPSK